MKLVKDLSGEDPNMIEYGVWKVEDGVGYWDTVGTLEEAVYQHGDKMIYQLTAKPVGKYMLETTVTKIKE